MTIPIVKKLSIVNKEITNYSVNVFLITPTVKIFTYLQYSFCENVIITPQIKHSLPQQFLQRSKKPLCKLFTFPRIPGHNDKPKRVYISRKPKNILKSTGTLCFRSTDPLRSYWVGP